MCGQTTGSGDCSHRKEAQSALSRLPAKVAERIRCAAYAITGAARRARVVGQPGVPPSHGRHAARPCERIRHTQVPGSQPHTKPWTDPVDAEQAQGTRAVERRGGAAFGDPGFSKKTAVRTLPILPSFGIRGEF